MGNFVVTHGRRREHSDAELPRVCDEFIVSVVDRSESVTSIARKLNLHDRLVECLLECRIDIGQGINPNGELLGGIDALLAESEKK